MQAVNRLQRLLSELVPGQSKKDITALQAKKILAGVRPRDLAGKTRKRLALEQLAEMVAIQAKIKASTNELKTLVLPGPAPTTLTRAHAHTEDHGRQTPRTRLLTTEGSRSDARGGALGLTERELPSRPRVRCSRSCRAFTMI